MFVDIVTYTQKHVAYKSSTVGRLAIYGLGLVKKVSNESDVGDSGRLLDSSSSILDPSYTTSSRQEYSRSKCTVLMEPPRGTQSFIHTS